MQILRLLTIIKHTSPQIAFIKNNDKSIFYSLIGWKYNKISKSYNRRKLKIPEKF